MIALPNKFGFMKFITYLYTKKLLNPIKSGKKSWGNI